MINVLTRFLEALYDEINPMDFYREIFGEGELQEKGIYDKGKYNGIIIEVTKEKIGDRRNKVLGIYKLNLNEKTGIIGEVSKIGDNKLSSERDSLIFKIQQNYVENKEVELEQEI